MSAPVLVVDDRPENLVAIQRILARLPVELSCHTSGEDALRATLGTRFALAILDVQMPGMDGYELAELLRGTADTRSLPIVFLTASHRGEEHVRRGYDAGAIDYMRKPVEAEVLVAKVHGFLRLYEAQHAVERLNAELREEVQRRGDAERQLREYQRTLEATVTERTRALGRSNHELKQFLYAAAHYLKTPLRTAGSFAGLLREDLEDGAVEEAMEDARRIEAATVRMTRLLDAMAEFGGVAADNPDRTPLDPRPLFEEAVASLGLTERVQLDPLPEVLGAHVAVLRVAEALLHNAVAHGPPIEQLSVVVDGDTSETEARIRVRDNGPGIADREIERVFEPFYRAQPDDGTPALGIGLTLCRGIMGSLGGDIRLGPADTGGTLVELVFERA